uniref:Large ribosomal subunit protein P2 n=1 Tax=Syphacia muris TaxID=451379 RepID=A0A0N5A9J1_9BILA
MRYVSAYMLASMTTAKGHGHGHHEHVVTVHDIENILGSVGVDCDKAMAQTVVNRLSGKSLEELIQQGLGSLCSMCASGSAAAAAPAAAGPAGDAPAPAAPAKAAETKKEEKKEEESDDDMGFGLFD